MSLCLFDGAWLQINGPGHEALTLLLPNASCLPLPFHSDAEGMSMLSPGSGALFVGMAEQAAIRLHSSGNLGVFVTAWDVGVMCCWRGGVYAGRAVWRRSIRLQKRGAGWLFPNTTSNTPPGNSFLLQQHSIMVPPTCTSSPPERLETMHEPAEPPVIRFTQSENVSTPNLPLDHIRRVS
jgi:hypothetical protein